MPSARTIEQHIAVFGESGSGKTVLLSSFYGAAQEPSFLKSSLFDVIADDTGLGSRLQRNYLEMRDSAQAPAQTKLSTTSYSFTLKPKSPRNGGAKVRRPADLRLVWHDYPGEWFENDVSGPEEERRRVTTFRALLGSNVAMLLVDAQKLIDNAGHEERYLKSLFGNLRTGLRRLEDELLPDGEPLVEFPRVWVLALSKSDLLPDLDVFGFRDLIARAAGDDVAELRRAIAGLIAAGDALSVGEDFVLLSAARFESERIDVSERFGVDLVLPIAAMLHVERHLRWARRRTTGGRVAEHLVDGAQGLMEAFGGLAALAAALQKHDGKAAKIVGGIGVALAALSSVLNDLAKWGGEELRKTNAAAIAKRDTLLAIYTGFEIALENGMRDNLLLRDRR